VQIALLDAINSRTDAVDRLSRGDALVDRKIKRDLSGLGAHWWETLRFFLSEILIIICETPLADQ
jgi:hypothetical protein